MELIIVIPIVIGIVLLILILKDREKRQKEFDKVFKPIEDLKKKIRNISYIEESINNDYKNINTTSEFIELGQLRHIYRYNHEKNEFWIEYLFKNNTEENKSFSVKKVELEVRGELIESNLTLLMEKVPEFMAPPYGNRYYSTKSHYGYGLGNSGQKEFLFNSRFKYELNNDNRFSKSDSITIYVDIQEYKDGQFISINKEIFFDYFNNILSTRVQEIDEIIKWNE